MAAMALGETKGGDSKSMERRKMVNTDIATPKQPCVTFSGAAAADCDGQQQPAKCQAAKRQAMTLGDFLATHARPRPLGESTALQAHGA